MPTRTELAAAALVATALAHAFFAQPLLFWPLVSLILSSAVLAMHSPLALSRRMTFLAHAQAHSILTAALAAAVSLAAVRAGMSVAQYYALVLTYVVLLNLAVLAVGRLGLREDAATGVVMSMQISATIILLFALRSLYSTTIDPLALITGEYVLITRDDVIMQIPFLAAATLYPIVFGTMYLYTAVDEHYAQATGVRLRLLDILFLVSMSVAVAASVYTLGSLMPAVLLVMPGAVAMRYTHKLTNLIPTAVSIALISVALAHFLYTLIPALWPTAAVGLALLALLLAKPENGLRKNKRSDTSVTISE
ncbi:ABC-type Mn2+/Zn2+ transport systems, permease component [Pyrobaculum oguniense TE7]|uniref:ABC-type Mn2+/Zn2+ transport systems, permease component n=1 Tax=Pyrobaculum oguniense (strain DSM 13380 / JCM 10595 / TE7) TaxID=698757 RepID=H6QBC0_PYROT|nr:ABC-type Mn2+/Zn2+ transport systems, permease component [Pyrobaculum oguniense TE7]